jgi:tRNA (guanine37-N1)-methyltransferase
MIHLGVISVLPEMFVSLQYGVCGRAIDAGIAKVDLWNPRDWSTRPHRHVDDKPYGGGPGMVMMYEPLQGAISHARSQLPAQSKVVYLSPQGKHVKQCDLSAIAAAEQPIVFLAGRYEGIDERVIEHHVDEEWSLGDFVLSGGELAAMVYIDAIVRLLPGSLGNPGSASQDSFMNGVLDHPHYTRPERIEGAQVPDVLRNGNHHEIQRWRRQQALGRTWLRRPELLDALHLNEADKQLLVEFIVKNGESV